MLLCRSDRYKLLSSLSFLSTSLAWSHLHGPISSIIVYCALQSQAGGNGSSLHLNNSHRALQSEILRKTLEWLYSLQCMKRWKEVLSRVQLNSPIVPAGSSSMGFSKQVLEWGVSCNVDFNINKIILRQKYHFILPVSSGQFILKIRRLLKATVHSPQNMPLAPEMSDKKIKLSCKSSLPLSPPHSATYITHTGRRSLY